MTVTENNPQVPVRLDFDTHAAGYSRAMSHLDNVTTKQLDAVEFDHRLRELVRIRASQLNGCAYCIDMHTKDARAVGETEQRIYALPAWAETPFFSDRERAALALTEAVTLLAQTPVPDEVFVTAGEHFTKDELGALISLITTINAWNTLAASTHAWEPGSYER